jgi:hypothetical protein
MTKRSMQIMAFPNELGNYTFRLAVRDFANHELKDNQGTRHTLNAKLADTR